MDVDLFFGTPRWKLLEILARRPSSPLELSRELNTSVSYASQQLKLLEAAGFVVKQKTRLVNKGQPRTVFSLSKEILHVTALLRGNSQKKIISLSEHNKIILQIWLLESFELHYPLEKFYWQIEEDISEIFGLFLSEGTSKSELIVVCESKRVEKKVKDISSDFKEFFICTLLQKADFLKRSFKNLSIIYDPQFMFNNLVENNQLKGGNV